MKYFKKPNASLLNSWKTVGISGLAHGINSSGYNKGYVVFILPVIESLGVSRAAISFVMALSRSEGGPIGPLAGWCVDKFGPKYMFLIGAVLSGTGFIALSMTDNIWTFGLVYLTLITIGSDLAFSNALSALVNNWFIRKRALAMSTYHAISSAAPALLVPLLALVIGLQGWQTASMVVGIVILTINIPIFFAITDRPEMLGFLPDGQVPDGPSKIRETATRSPDTDPRDFTLIQALKTSSFWLMLTGSCLRLTAKAGVILHIIPIFVWKGMDQQTAAVIFGFLLLLMVPLSVIFGWLADIVPKNWVLCITSISGTFSFLLLAVGGSETWYIYAFIFLFAIAETSGSNNWAAIGDYYGRTTYGRLRGITQFASSPGVFLAPVFAGWCYDQVQNYTLPLWVFTVFFASAAICFALMRKPATPIQQESRYSLNVNLT